jgi:predicted ATPase
MQSNKRVVISGSPGGGKTSIINGLNNKGYTTFEEYSRSLITKAQKEGVENYFLKDPEAFSNKIFEGRLKQFHKADQNETSKPLFYDRGVHDTFAYLKAIGKATENWKKRIANYTYDFVFLVAPWKEIYTKDAQRLETFEQAHYYYPFILETYSKQHQIIELPKTSIEERIGIIETHIKSYG